ncbi:MAG: hypothetical protein HY259_14185 [Chloroflexi bacterium]|nr:hypothetical protein [Chloroflexota bacterium]
MIPFEIAVKDGAPVRVGGYTLVVRARVVQLRLPGSHGGLIWNRPIELSARDAAGAERILPIRDVTRRRQLRWLGLGLLGAWLISSARRRSR